jgi:guanine deaminase
MLAQVIRGPLLIPQENGQIVYHADGVLACDERGIITFAGPWSESKFIATRRADGIMLPPLIDIHIHVPQHPIRGRFLEGVADHVPGGRLLAGLKRNVFPAEAKCSDIELTRQIVRDFYSDTLSHGVVGGAAYMTVSAAATEIALQSLPQSWSVGLVLMNQNCPENLRTDEPNLERDYAKLSERFGRRVIVTDRFAVSVDSPLRRRGVDLAARHGLRTQTHLNEQIGEKQCVESELYPDAKSYTDVYRRDGLLNHHCILAHCIHMRPDEWSIVRDTNSVVAHCPTSNLHLGSGIMNLDEVANRGIPYSIATDVGASPTVSMLAEMGRFLQVHAGRTSKATETEALYRATLAPAKILGLDQSLGRLEAGRPMSFIETRSKLGDAPPTASEAIRSILPDDLDHPTPAVARVTLNGRLEFERTK